MNSLPECGEQATVSQQELDLLDTLPDNEIAIDFSMLGCELQGGHSGPHLALGQIYGGPLGRARWLRWIPGASRDWLDVANAEHCAAEGAPNFDEIPDDRESCVFPAQHPGGHSFEVG
jgi:hypothetical protein